MHGYPSSKRLENNLHPMVSTSEATGVTSKTISSREDVETMLMSDTFPTYVDSSMYDILFDSKFQLQ